MVDSANPRLGHLGLEVWTEKNIGGLDIPVNDPVPAAFVQVMQTSSYSDGDLVPRRPVQKLAVFT